MRNSTSLFAGMRKAILALIIGVIPIGSQAAEQTIFYHLDALGSPIAATDEGGNLLWREEYRPYGDKIQKDPASAINSRAFTGHPHDDTTGLTYAGARHYDPVVGRFMAVDPAPFAENNIHSFNRYADGNNNPYRYVDPDGQAAVLALIPPIIIGGGIVYYAATPEQRAQMGRDIAQLGRNFTDNTQWLGGKIGSLIFKEGDGSKADADQGCIYCVPGSKTSSGRDYVGSTDNLDQRAKDRSDGRDRRAAQIVDTYPKGSRDERRRKEQQAINDRGGVGNLDNGRNEIAPNKWEDKGVKPPS